MSSTNLWPVLFAPLAVVLLVLFIVAVAAILYRKRRSLNLKAGKGSPEDDKEIEKGKGWSIPFFNLQGHDYNQFKCEPELDCIFGGYSHSLYL